MGGMHGFGPVTTDEPDETPFHERWEGRVHAMMIASSAGRAPRRGSFRYAIESMGQVEYLTTSYYEHWLVALETLLVDGGALGAGALDQRISQGRLDVAETVVPELAERARSILTRPRRARSADGLPYRFAVGDRVRVATTSVSHEGHTRCPRYIRGRLGVVDRLCAPEPMPEWLPDGRSEDMATYTVRFASTELWGDDAERFTLTVDLVEPYLTPVHHGGTPTSEDLT